MTQELVLQTFLIDIVQAVAGDDIVPGPQVQLVTYKVLAQTADHALQRFFNEDAGVIMYEGDVVDRILVGLQIGTEAIDAQSL